MKKMLFPFVFLLFATIPSICGFNGTASEPSPEDTITARYPMGAFMGTNSFIDVPVDRLEPVGWIREYHPWSFTEIENDVFEYNRWNGFWDFDAFYNELATNQVMVCPVLWSSPTWLQPAANDRPVVGDEDPALPYSYREIAELQYQYAARYGAATVPDSMLLVNSGQVKKTGLGLIRYYEDWNEQDKDWEGPSAEFTPAQYAAMASANIDGHQGSLGAGTGIKQADPEAKFVMGGLAGLDTSYLTGMRKWFGQHRTDTDWPVDVINVHHYAFTRNETGISPEDDNYRDKVAAVVRWRDLHAPGNEVWLTEFGYDTNPTSMNRAPAIGTLTSVEVQAGWNMRTFMLLAAAGVDRAAQFMIRDADPGGSELRYADSGLTTSKEEGHKRKLSWYYMHTMYRLLEDLYFRDVITDQEELKVMRFTEHSAKHSVYSCWRNSGSDQPAPFTLEIEELTDSVSIVTLNSEYPDGLVTRVALENGSVTIEAGEIPVFVVVEAKESSAETDLARPGAEIKVYPNPANNCLHMHFSAPISRFKNIKVSIINATGTEIRIVDHIYKSNAATASIDTTMLPDGLYFIQVTGLGFRPLAKPFIISGQS